MSFVLRVAVAVLVGLVAWSAGVRADSLVSNLPTSATSPMTPLSCLYVDQAAVGDAKVCATNPLGSSMAVYFGAAAVVNNGSDFQSPSATLLNLGGAPLASPTLTGTPRAPTAAQTDNGTQIATSGFVKLQQGPPASIAWISGVNPGTACGGGCLILASVQQAQTIRSIHARLSAGGDTGASLSVYKAAAGAACPGTVLHSGNVNLAGTVNADQPLSLTVTTLNVGESICVGSSGVVTSSAGTISVYLTPQ